MNDHLVFFYGIITLESHSDNSITITDAPYYLPSTCSHSTIAAIFDFIKLTNDNIGDHYHVVLFTKFIDKLRVLQKSRCVRNSDLITAEKLLCLPLRILEYSTVGFRPFQNRLFTRQAALGSG